MLALARSKTPQMLAVNSPSAPAHSGRFTSRVSLSPPFPVVKGRSSLPSLHRSEAASDSEPIIDFPTPPVQIATCRHGQIGFLVALPLIATSPQSEISQMAFQKLKQCNRICDFSDPNADLTSKQVKTQALNELIDCYANPKLFARVTRECHQQVIELFSVNIFRPLPNVPREILASDEVTIEDTAWPHLQLVYALFLTFLNCSIDQKILQWLKPRFITNLFAILDFPDERERMQVRAVITSIFNKVPPQRSQLRTLTANLLMGVPGGFCINAASHLLELFHSFTSSTTAPLGAALIGVFDRVLLPMHLGLRCQRYFGSLSRCVVLMVRKEKRLGSSLLHFLIRHWPMTLDHKAELFIDEATQLLEENVIECFAQHMCQLMSCIAVATESPCTTLADRALSFLMHDHVRELIADDPYSMMRIIFPSLFRGAKSHWTPRIQLKALTAMNMLLEVNPDVCASIAEEFRTESLAEREKNIAHQSLWDQVAQTAAQNLDLVDTDAVSEEFAKFFGAVHTVRRATGHHRKVFQPLVGFAAAGEVPG
jgi:hypothetical protein